VEAIGMLRQQFQTVNIRLNYVCGQIGPELLLSRVAPGANPVGFGLWHMARTQDWGVNTAIRGVPEVAHRPVWTGSPLGRIPGIGTGFRPDEVDLVTASVDLPALVAYANEVHAEAFSWLGTLDEADLDVVPDVLGNMAGYPEYQRPEFVDEMSSGPEHDEAVAYRGGLPTWLLLTSVCVTHLHRHLGEIDLTLGVLIGRAG